MSAFGSCKARESSDKKSQCLPLIKNYDPLFGVLSEELVGVNPITGKLKINPEVLEDLRRYLVANNGDDLSVKK